MKKRESQPWMPADEYGKSLTGFGVNLLVVEIARARQRGDTILAGAMDKPHGLREVYIVDPDGSVWVPGKAL